MARERLMLDDLERVIWWSLDRKHSKTGKRCEIGHSYNGTLLGTHMLRVWWPDGLDLRITFKVQLQGHPLETSPKRSNGVI